LATAGNTNTVFAVFEGERLKGQWRISTEPQRTADEYAVWLGQLFALDGLGFNNIDDAVISTVVPQGLRALVELSRQYAKCDPLVVTTDIDLGLAVKLDRPEEVGADRLVNAVAAHASFDGALILIDFGTATTFDAIDAQGAYCGGVIAPGINLSLEALHQAAAMLPRIAVERPAQVIGDSTISAMQSGIYWGYVGLIEGIVARMKAEFAEPMRGVATGGLAPLFAGATPEIDEVSPNLTMRGLLEIHRRNRGRARAP
jgi:type III pantothenate kinase